jgi:hypothetical protein
MEAWMSANSDVHAALECHVRELAGRRVLTANDAAETLTAIRSLTAGSDAAIRSLSSPTTPSADAVLRAKFMLGQIGEDELTRRRRQIVRGGGWVFGTMMACCFATPVVVFYSLRSDAPVWFLVGGLIMASVLATIGGVVWTLAMYERLIGRWVKAIAFDSAF